MKHLLLFIHFLIFGFIGYSQSTERISEKDSLALKSFWNKIRIEIKNDDRKALLNLFDFPFYCVPCSNNSQSLKVTKKLFLKDSFDLSFLKKIELEIEKNREFQLSKFHKNTENGEIVTNKFYFLYTIVLPSKTWEGSQGMVNLKRIKDNFIITGIDNIP